MIFWYSKLYFRTLRDTTDDWQDWQRLLTVSDEGTGNGLDADTLDGVEGSSFLRSDATDTASGAITLSNFVSFTMDGNTITGIDDSGEFTNNDSHIMTSAAVEDKILSYGYTTGTGTVDTSGTPVDDDFAKFTDANTIEGRSAAETISDLGLGDLALADDIAASKVVSGTLDAARIPLNH